MHIMGTLLLIKCLAGYTFGRCPRDEYRVGFECCPLCPPGSHFVKDCTERSITKCSTCPDGTFQAGLNKEQQCSNCTKCEAGLGLKVKRLCTPKSDAVCETLDGSFCSDSNGDGCMAAQRHTVCSPGQYIGQTGTADKDTECLHCTDGTFSDGTSSCQPHATCDSGVQIQPGTDSTDSTCIPYPMTVFIIIGCVISPVIAIIALGAWVYIRRLKEKEKQGWLHGEAAGERTAGPSSTSLLSLELPAGLETSIPPMKHSLLKKLDCQTQ